MTQHPDSTGPVSIIYEPARHASSFQVSGWRHGMPFVVSGSVPVPVFAALEVTDAPAAVSREALKMLLREISEKL